MAEEIETLGMPGSPLVFFDARSKVRLFRHHTSSDVYGDIEGGSTLVLEGENFAPLGDGLACVFDTPMRVVGNDTVNASAIVATFISPTRLACQSPPYIRRLGESSVYINTTYNSSIFDNPPARAETVDFIYYDRRLPPDVTGIVPPYAPLNGRAIRFTGGLGPWYMYSGDGPVGGAILLGRNFAPTNFLWCAYGMPEAQYTTGRGPWKWTRGVYLNSSAIQCEVPAGYLGDHPVAASTDDRLFSTVTSILTFYNPKETALISPGQKVGSAFPNLTDLPSCPRAPANA